MKLADINLLDVGHTIGLVGAVYEDGHTRELMFCPFPGEEHTAEAVVVHDLVMSADEWALFLRQSDLLETETIEKAKDGRVTKAVLRKSARQIEQGVSWAVFRRDGYTCRYCARADVPLTVDHLVLWEEGGPSIEENLVAACKRCNRTRGNQQYADWLRSAHYLDVSCALTDAGRGLNAKLASTLAAIPRRTHKRSR